ncbi:MAG TPA: signal peptide peptidase SppA [Cryomorphaceae bacterium]|nr:signal peptide peptidase SppA [Cryomorphaceae bacterium]
MFASLLGTLISLFVLLFVGILIIAGIFSAALGDLDKSSQVTRVKDNSILHIEFDQPIVDRGPDEHFNINFGGFQSSTPLGLDEIIENIEKAKNDEKIEGIYFDVEFVPAGLATTQEIRKALLDFKESGKWIVSYNAIYTQKALYLSSVADEIYLYPEGFMDFRGLNAEVTFFKKLLDDLKIEPQIIRGSNNKFKSAVEPFILEEMSQANRVQTMKWLDSMWGTMLDGMGESYSLSADRLNEIAENYSIRIPSDAVDVGMATALMYEDDVMNILREKTGRDEDDELNFVTLRKYLKAPKPPKEDGEFTLSYKKDKIAVIFAQGNIGLGESGDGAIGSETYTEAIKSARKDTSVKAIVLRVNSPGGVAIAGDMIWHEVVEAQKAKPLVVSMGDLAASAGYYISAPADKIFAMPTTITGSIGVFGIIPNMKGFFNDKIGLTFDNVETNQFADFGGISRPLNDAEMTILQNSVDRTYETFVDIVAKGRNLRPEFIDSIGQGRVWSGADALELGLVDELGGLEEAIAEAAEMAGIEDYTIKELPKRKDPFQELLEDLNMAMVKTALGFDVENSELIEQYKTIQDIKDMKGIQARMPFVMKVD